MKLTYNTKLIKKALKAAELTVKPKKPKKPMKPKKPKVNSHENNRAN